MPGDRQLPLQQTQECVQCCPKLVALLVCSLKFTVHWHFLFSKEPWREASHLSDAILQSHMQLCHFQTLSPVPIIKGQYAEVHHFFLLPVQLTTRVCAKSCYPRNFQLVLGHWNEPLSSLRSFWSQRIYIKCLNHMQTLNTIALVLSLAKQKPNEEAIRVGKTSTNLHYQNQGSMQSGCPCSP